MRHVRGQNLLEQFLVRRNTASVEIPRRRFTVGESPLYDLRLRWTTITHIATFDSAFMHEAAMRPGLKTVSHS
jgi:hypothetical protein